MATAKQLKDLKTKQAKIMAEQKEKPKSLGMGNPMRKEPRARIPVNGFVNTSTINEDMEKAGVQLPKDKKPLKPRIKSTGEPGMNYFSHPRIQN